MLIGLLPSTVTLRFFKYFSSSLYGCLAPVLLKSKVMNKTGPSISDSLGTGVGLSVAGPIAGAVFSLVKVYGKVAAAVDDLAAASFFTGSQTWGLKFRGEDEEAVPIGLFSSGCSMGSMIVAGPGAEELPKAKLMTACWPSLPVPADVGKGPKSDFAGTLSVACCVLSNDSEGDGVD